MNTFSKDELKNLTDAQKGLCVSIFMPTYRAGAESQQNQIRLRNLLREAEEKLVVRGCRPQDAKSLLEPAQSLVGNVLFWRRQGDGLAIFASAEIFRRYCLPAAFPELAVVDDRFHLKPLLPALGSEGRFYILALSQNGVRLLEGSAFSAAEVDLETIPKNLAEALQLDQPEKQVRFRAGSAGGQGAMISGHGAEIEDTKDNILKYFRQIDKGLRDFLKEERVPLVLAGVEYLLPIYKEANTYPHLVAEGIPGNPKGVNADQLQKAAWQIVKPLFARAQTDAIAQYRQSSGTGLTSSRIEEILSATVHGRIAVLFVALGMQRFGTFDSEKGEVRLHETMQPGAQDLLDFAAIQTVLSGGKVYALPPDEVPDRLPIAAIFRY